MREFCGLNRNSLNLPVAPLLYGTLPKLLPMDPPAFSLLNTAVKSRKPIGWMVASPTLNCRGAVASPAGTCGSSTRGAGEGGGGGSTGEVEATSPKFGNMWTGVVAVSDAGENDATTAGVEPGAAVGAAAVLEGSAVVAAAV